MGCSLVRASKEVGLATWKAAEDGSSLDLKVSEGGIHKPPNPEAAATQRPTGQGLRRLVDAAPLSDEVCGDPGKLRRVMRARPLHRLQVERRQRRWLRLRSVMDARRRVNAHTPLRRLAAARHASSTPAAGRPPSAGTQGTAMF